MQADADAPRWLTIMAADAALDEVGAVALALDQAH